MKLEEYDVVRVSRALPDHDLPAGAEGTIVMDHTKYSSPSVPPAYEVEFTDVNGAAGGVFTIAGDDLEVVRRPH